MTIAMTMTMTMTITLSIQEKAEWPRRRKTKRTKDKVFRQGGVAIRSLARIVKVVKTVKMIGMTAWFGLVWLVSPASFG